MASSLPAPQSSRPASSSEPGPRPALRPATLALSDLPRRFGRYVLLRRIAKGGMGEVMLAASLGLEGAERPVIIKTIRAEHRTDKSFKARFLDEARVQAQLEHPGVCQVLEATTDDESGEPYVVVEHIDGRSLGDVRARALTTGARIEWHEAVAIAQLAAEALSHVHERPDAQSKPLSIVHRDLSPQNLMVSYGGEVKIIDFGTARGENRRCHTVSGVVFAKPGYVAPEVANGDSGDFRVDLYALGVMLWELCAGRRFLQGEATDHMGAVAKNERNLPPVAEISGAPRALDDILAKLTAFDRDARYARTKLAARDLASVLIAAPPMPGGDRGVRPRVAAVMHRLFDGESTKARREFLRLVGEARKIFSSARTPSVATPQAAQQMKDEQEGLVPGTRYRMLREIARGNGTLVLEAEHVDLGRPVAIKILETVGSAAAATVQSRLRREARVLSSLDVPGVVRVIDVGQTLDARPFAVLELCQGDTLEVRIRRGDVFAWKDALDVADKLLSVLTRVHGAGVIHRDIKPANLVVADNGALTLVDFGIALSRAEADMSDLDTPAPRPALSLYGTPEYMAPEQAARPNEVDERADIYALGAILYELLTGRLPFVADSPMAILDAKAKGSPEPPSERAPSRSIPPAVDALCLRALARHPTLRFASAREMQLAVREALTAPAALRSRRRRFGYLAIGSVMVCATALFAAGATRSSDTLAELLDGLRGRHVEAPVAERAAAAEAVPVVEPAELAGEIEAPSDAPGEAQVEPAPAPADEAVVDEPALAREAAAGEPSEVEAAEAPERRAEPKKRRAETKKGDGSKKKTRKRKGKGKKTQP